MKVIVTGGTGFVGRYVVKELINSGHKPYLLIRDPAKARELFGDEVAITEVDFFSKDSLRKALKESGAKYIVHLIGILFEMPRKGITFEKVHFEIPKNLYEVAMEEGVKKIVHMSSLGTSDKAPSKYHSTKRKAEKFLMETGISYVILRPSLILGPEQKLFADMDRITRLFPVVALPGSGSYRFAPISVRDVARCFARALTRRKTDNSIYALCGPAEVTFKKLLEDTFRIMGRKVLLMPLPRTLMTIAGAVAEKILEPPPFSSDQMRMMWRDNICGLDPEENPEGVKVLTGQEPEGYEETIRWAVEGYMLTSPSR